MKYITMLLLSLCLLSCRNRATRAGKAQTINVTGNATLKVRPDKAIVTLNASAMAANKKAVIADMSRMVETLLKQVKDQHIKTTKTVINDLSIDWSFEYHKDKTKTMIYSARQSIVIEMPVSGDDIEKVVGIVNGIPKLDFYIGFALTDHKRDSAEDVVTTMAIKDAGRLSQNIATAAGLEIKEILDISYHVDHPNAMMAEKRRMMPMADAEAIGAGFQPHINLSPEDIELGDNIQVTYLVGKP